MLDFTHNESDGTYLVKSDTDMSELMHGCIRRCLEVKSPDVAANIESHFYNMQLMCPSCDFDLDVGKHVWLNIGRWSRLIKEYIDRSSLDIFIEQANQIYHGHKGIRDGATANMMFRSPKRYDKKHRWGGCLMGMTFRGGRNHRPTLTMYSRTTYMGYMGLLDAAIASVLAGYITDNVENIEFKWFISSCQVHSFKTLPYVFSQPDLFKKLEKFARSNMRSKVSLKKKVPISWYYMTQWYCKILDSYDRYGVDMIEDNNEKYGPFKRIKRRWLEHMCLLDKNLPPSLKIEELTFEKAISGPLPEKETK